MKLYKVFLSVLLVLSTSLLAVLGVSVGHDDMIEYQTTMPDDSIITYEVHKRARFSAMLDKRAESDDVPFNATNLPSAVFSNATTISANGSSPGPAELFQLIWTDKNWNWTEVNYCGWNAPLSTLTPGPWVNDCLKLADIWAVLPGFWDVSDWGGDSELNRLVRYKTCELWVARTDMRYGDVRIGNADIVIFTLQAAAKGWLDEGSRQAIMYTVQGFPACYDLDTGGRAGIEFQVIRNEHVPIPSNTQNWPALTATPTASTVGQPYPTSIYTGD